MNRFFRWIMGISLPILEQLSITETMKQSAIAVTIFIPVIFGGLTCAYAMNLVFDNYWVAIPCGLLWSGVILLIDKLILSSSDAGLGANLMRFLLACVFSFTITEPLLLRLFRDEIKLQQDKDLAIEIKQIEAGDTAQIATIKTEMENAGEVVKQYWNDYKEEIDGTGGSGIARIGPLAKRKEQKYNEEKANYEKFSIDKNKQIETILANQDKQINELTAEFDTGLLGRLKTLGKLSDQNDTVWYSSWLLRLVFLFLELIPLIAKISMSANSLTKKIIDRESQAIVEANEANNQQMTELAIHNQKLILLSRKLGIHRDMVTTTLNSSMEVFKNFATMLTLISEKKAGFIQTIIDTVKDPKQQSELLGELDTIFNSYRKILENLVADSSSFYKTA